MSIFRCVMMDHFYIIIYDAGETRYLRGKYNRFSHGIAYDIVSRSFLNEKISLLYKTNYKSFQNVYKFKTKSYFITIIKVIIALQNY